MITKILGVSIILSIPVYDLQVPALDDPILQGSDLRNRPH